MVNINMIPKEINFEDGRKIFLVDNRAQFSRQSS